MNMYKSDYLKTYHNTSRAIFIFINHLIITVHTFYHTMVLIESNVEFLQKLSKAQTMNEWCC